MVQVLNHDFRISGTLQAGNIVRGRTTITPVANTPTSATVTGLSLQGAGSVTGLCTTVSGAPGTVQETTVSSVSATGVTLWVYRSNTSDTPVDWMLFRKRV